MSTLDSARAHAVELHYPAQGAWRADVILEGGALPPVGVPVTLTVGDLALRGSVLRVDFDAPDRPHAVVTGGAGWERAVVKPFSYQSDSGVKLSTVLKDLAVAAGETIEQPSDVILGDKFTSPAARAGEVVRLRDVLSALARNRYLAPWRVDPDGVTRFGERAGVPVTARATVMRRDAAVGLTVVGLDSPSAFLPGNILNGSAIATLVVRDTASKLTADVYTPKPSITTTLLRKVAEMFPSLFYGYPRTYRVDAVRSDGRLDLVPPPDAQHLAELAAVEQWSVGGVLIKPVKGAEVTVHFRDANPTRPVVIGWAGATQPTEIDAGQHVSTAAGDETGHAVFYGDTVQMFVGAAAVPTPIKLMRVGTLVALAGNPLADVSTVKG